MQLQIVPIKAQKGVSLLVREQGAIQARISMALSPSAAALLSSAAPGADGENLALPSEQFKKNKGPLLVYTKYLHLSYRD